MNCTACLNRAMAVFNEQMGADFSSENVVLACFETGNQVEVFEQFCKACFPYRLADRYKEEGYLILFRYLGIWMMYFCFPH